MSGIYYVKVPCGWNFNRHKMLLYIYIYRVHAIHVFKPPTDEKVFLDKFTFSYMYAHQIFLDRFCCSCARNVVKHLYHVKAAFVCQNHRSVSSTLVTFSLEAVYTNKAGMIMIGTIKAPWQGKMSIFCRAHEQVKLVKVFRTVNLTSRHVLVWDMIELMNWSQLQCLCICKWAPFVLTCSFRLLNEYVL